jgi:hypothetical protein
MVIQNRRWQFWTYIIICQTADSSVTCQLLVNYAHFESFTNNWYTIISFRLTVCVIIKKLVKMSRVCLRTCVCMWQILSGQNEGWQMDYMDQAAKLHFSNYKIEILCCWRKFLKPQPLTTFILPHFQTYFNILGTPVYTVNCNLWAGLPLGNERSCYTAVSCFSVKSVSPLA